MFSFDLAQDLKKDGITVNALHPGSLLNTKMVREALAIPMGGAQQGAEAEVYLATSSELEGVTGRLFDRRNETIAYSQAYDPEARNRLRELSLRLVGLHN
jgi:NAD(P)-dependent dehydrogenase (short-subunit alcohol dehydrogenase family)